MIDGKLHLRQYKKTFQNHSHQVVVNSGHRNQICFKYKQADYPKQQLNFQISLISKNEHSRDFCINPAKYGEIRNLRIIKTIFPVN